MSISTERQRHGSGEMLSDADAKMGIIPNLASASSV